MVDKTHESSLSGYMRWIIFKQVGLSNAKKVQFAKMKLICSAMDYWHNIENLHLRRDNPHKTDWEGNERKIMQDICPLIISKEMLA